MRVEEKDTLREKRIANLTAPRFKPGQSGNPSGRPKNVLSKALRKKLEEARGRRYGFMPFAFM